MAYLVGGRRVAFRQGAQSMRFIDAGAQQPKPWPTPNVLSEGDYFRTADTATATKSGSAYTFTIPASGSPATPRRTECQWYANGVYPRYTDGQVARLDFTITGNLGAAAQTTTQDHWHVVCQMYGPADDPANPWDRFVKHGCRIKGGKISWYGGDAHPQHQWTQAESRAYDVPLADYTDGTTYRIVVQARMSDHPDGWITVWCNGVLWPVGERWRPIGQWAGVENGNPVGVKYTQAAGSWVALRNGLYRGTNSAQADRPTYQQSVTVTPAYLTPDPATIPVFPEPRLGSSPGST